jgi:hypothetical protein
MSTFKCKPDKVRHAIDVNTLDGSYRKQADHFLKRRALLPKKKIKLKNLQSKLNKFESKNKIDFTTKDIKDTSNIKTEINNINDEIYDIENNISEIEYYSKIDDILMDYFEIIEKDDNRLYNNNPELHEEKKINSDQYDYSDLEKLSQLKSKKKKKLPVVKRRKRNGDVDTINPIASYLGISSVNQDKETNDKSRAELHELYKIITDGEYHSDKIKKNRELKKCPDCGNERTINQTEGISVCEECGLFEMVIIEPEKPNYKDNCVPEKPGYPYKRVSGLPLKSIRMLSYYFIAIISNCGKILTLILQHHN